MAQPMPESVKVARVGHEIDAPATIAGKKFDIKMGPDEVMILLAFHWWWSAASVEAGLNRVIMGLWRKSETMPLGTICYTASPDMIWAQQDSISVVAGAPMAMSNAAYVTLPWPMVLIRAPQFVVNTIVVTDFIAEMRLYYLLREVGDVDLAKLMVKDHA